MQDGRRTHAFLKQNPSASSLSLSGERGTELLDGQRKGFRGNKGLADTQPLRTIAGCQEGNDEKKGSENAKHKEKQESFRPSS